MTTSQTRAVPSSEAVTACLPSGLNAAELIGPPWPFSSTNVPPETSHTRAVRSLDVVRMCDPSGLNAAEVTGPAWPCNTEIGWPVPASQTRAVPSWDAVTMREPSGLNAAAFNQSGDPTSKTDLARLAFRIVPPSGVETSRTRAPSRRNVPDRRSLSGSCSLRT